jgi:hypothetical protein
MDERVTEINKTESHRTARERYDEEVRRLDTEYRLMHDDYCFALNIDNCQWDEHVRSAREDSTNPRPCLTVNKIPEKIDAAEGAFRELSPSYKLRPMDSIKDPGLVNIITGIVKHIESNSNARSIYNSSYSTKSYSGIGGWRIDIVNDENDPFVKNIHLNHIADPFSVRWDPFSTNPFKLDARYVFISSTIPKDTFLKKWPKATPISFEDSNINSRWTSENSITVVEYWWKELTPVNYIRITREGRITATESDKMLPTDKIYPDKNGMRQEKTVLKNKIFYGKLTHNEFIEGPFEWPIELFPIIHDPGKTNFIEGLNRSRSIHRHAKDGQMMYNYWVSTATEQVGMAPKAPHYVTPDQIEGYEHMWDTANTKNWPYLPFNPDPLNPGPPSRVQPPAASSAYATELTRLNNDIMSAIGIYEAQLGARGPEVTGIAVEARQRQGALGTYIYTSNFQQALTNSLKVIVSLIPHIYDSERILRIHGVDNKEEVIALNAPIDIIQQLGLNPDLHIQGQDGLFNRMTEIGKFDVVVDIGPAHATQRKESLNQLIELITRVPSIGPYMVDLIAGNIDSSFSEELAARLRRTIPQNILNEPDPDQPPPPDPTLLLAQQEIQNNQAANIINQKELELKAFIETSKLELQKEKQELTEFKTIMEAQNKNIEEIIKLKEVIDRFQEKITSNTGDGIKNNIENGIKDTTETEREE